MRKPKYKYPLVEVIWADAVDDETWSDRNGEDDMPWITSVGFLIADKVDSNGIEFVKLSNGYHGEHVVSSFRIPKNMIQSLKVLK